MEGLPPSISSEFSKLTVVGMRHYKEAHQRIIEASRRPPENQCLFLVSDINNRFDKNAVMLHDGVAKLGHIAARECARVREFLNKESLNRGQDVVLVVYVPHIDSDNFQWSTSFNVKVVGVVYERIARKFSRSILKQEK